jgi:hypothetical protein
MDTTRNTPGKILSEVKSDFGNPALPTLKSTFKPYRLPTVKETITISTPENVIRQPFYYRL